MPGLLTQKTDLKSLKYGHDRPGGGSSNQPYIKTDINSIDSNFNQIRLTRFDDGLITGGIIGATNASVTDTLRIGKFLTDVPKGPLFIIKQVGLQLSNPRLESKKLFANLPTTGRGFLNNVGNFIINTVNSIENAVGPTRVYNLGVNTIAQIPVNAFGGHIVRHGFLPIEDPRGPQSVYGLGSTIIKRYDDTENGLKIQFAFDQSKMFSDYSNPVLKKYSDISKQVDKQSFNGYGELIYRNSVDGIDGKVGYLLPTSHDKISYKNKLGETISFNKEWNGGTREIRVTSGRKDGINLTPLFTTKDKNIGSIKDSITIEGKKYNINDLVKFRIQAIDTDNPSSLASWMIFRAYITSLNDNVDASWNEIKYAGRGDKFYIYDGFSRKMSVNFKVAALSEKEMEPMYQKLNYLMSNLMPDYQNNLMRGPLMRMTIGNWIDGQLCILNSLSYSIPNDSPWEIALGEDDGGKRLLILPHVVEVSLSFTPIGSQTRDNNKISEKNATTSHIAQNWNGATEGEYIYPDINKVLKAGDRLDLLSYQYYKDVNLWWIIAAANNNVTKDTFKPEIQTQLLKRQDAINNRTHNNLQYYNSRNAWIRLSSSVNTYKKDAPKLTSLNPTEQELKTYLEALNNEANYDNTLAKQYILQGGILNNSGSLKSGLGEFNNAYSNIGANGNPYRLGIRPMPGITGLDIKSKGAYGSLREAVVNFQCWDIKQLEDLELLYMRPGYSVLLEWGWTPYLDNKGDLTSIVDYTDIVNKTYSKEELWKIQNAKSTNGQYSHNGTNKNVTSHYGNYDSMYGFVKNFSWNARNDGGYDCQTTIISIGEVIESLKINYSPFDNISSIISNGLISPNIQDDFKIINTGEMDLSGSYSHNILAGVFEEIWNISRQIAEKKENDIKNKDTGMSLLLHDNKYNVDYDIFYKKLNIKSSNAESYTSTGTIGKSDEQVYISLETLTHLLNNYVLLRDKKSNSPFTKLSVYEQEDIKSDPISGSNYLLSLAHPLQISIDPTICLIKNSLWINGIKIKIENNTSNNQNNNVIKYGTHNYNPTTTEGKIWWDNLIAKIKDAKKDSKKINTLKGFYDLLKEGLELPEDIYDALGVKNSNIFGAPLLINEKNIEAAKEDPKILQVQNTKSIVRSYSLQSNIPPELSTIVAIGSQVKGGALASDNNTLIDFNRGLIDRIIPVKDVPSKMDGIGGIVIGNLFKLPSDILPKGYKGENNIGRKIGYIVTGIGHSIHNNDWITKLDSQFVVLDKPDNGVNIDFSNLTLSLNPSGDVQSITNKNTTVNFQSVNNFGNVTSTVPPYGSAILDMISHTEGTVNHGQNGYDVLFGYKLIPNWNENYTGGHPSTVISIGNFDSSAAGRYQILKGTWNTIANGKNFNKKNQDEVGFKLVKNRVIGGETTMKAAFDLASQGIKDVNQNQPFLTMLGKGKLGLAGGWASIPDKNGKYQYNGQGHIGISVQDVYNIYIQAVNKYK
ncbi:unnamed protein product [Wuchereria bancrofti]|uniref:Uncharacterized protein n=1 Tax=Wuchereria bancrofti TaxID=6293 RepID=A0A3P7DQ66_WUCBA|nr:unnamed protein product [Wuchereria bancrofti]